MIVELLRDDGTVADTQQLRDGQQGQRAEFRTGIVGRFVSTRVHVGATAHVVDLNAPLIGGDGVTPIVQFAFPDIIPIAPLYRNPAWRCYHGDNHVLLVDADAWAQPWSREAQALCTLCGRHQRVEWVGLPKPPLRSLAGHRLNERFTHLRDHAWLRAIGHVEGVSRTLAEVQADMPDWPHLFAFHAFTAVWLTLDEDDQVVLLDAWEAANIGNDCNGRLCEGAA